MGKVQLRYKSLVEAGVKSNLYHDPGAIACDIPTRIIFTPIDVIEMGLRITHADVIRVVSKYETVATGRAVV